MPRTKKCKTCSQPLPKVAKAGDALPESAPASAPALPEPAPAPAKKKRAPTEYSLFVKKHYGTVKDIPLKDRFKHISGLWKKHRAGAGMPGAHKNEQKEEVKK